MITRAVSYTILDQYGNPVDGASISAVLDRTDYDGAEEITPAVRVSQSDASGQGTLNLWPNARGTSGSRYRVIATNPSGRVLLNVWADVPDADTTLADISTPFTGPGTVGSGLSSAVTAAITASIASGLSDHVAASDPHTQYVQKIAGKGLSPEEYTSAEKTKLASLESSRFIGQYPSLVSLQAAHPSASAGQYGYVDNGVGNLVSKYIWDTDDSQWVQQLGDSDIETPATVKQKYEDNADTNAFTDAEKAKLGTVAENASANQSDAHLLDRANHTGTQPIATITGLQTSLDSKLPSNDVTLLTLTAGSNITIAETGAAELTISATAAEGATNLSFTRDSTTVTVESSSGDDAVLPVATTSMAGVLSASDKTKLDGIESSATANDTDANLVDRTNHTGVQAISTITGLQSALDAKVATSNKAAQVEAEAGTDNTKWMTPLATKQAIDIFASSSGEANTAANVGAGDGLYKNKVGTALNFKTLIGGDGITLSAGADDITVSASVALGMSASSTTVTVTNNSGDDSVLVAATGTDAGIMTAAMFTKLDGIETAATANDSDANLLDRANHTGAQAISTITDLQTTLDAKVATSNKAELADAQGLIDDTKWTTTAMVVQTVNAMDVDGEVNTVSNVGSGTGLYKDKSGAELRFKTLVAGTNITLATPDADTVSITASALATDLSEGTRTGTSVIVESSTGDDVTLSLADTSYAGLMSAADWNKLDGIEAGATANSTDANLRDRATHTGAQAISTITDLQTTLDAKLAIASKADYSDAVAGTDDTNYMTAIRSHDAASALITTHNGSSSAHADLYREESPVEITASTTLTESHREKRLRVNSGSAVVLTLPQTSTEDLGDKFVCAVQRAGTGTVSFAVEGSETLEATGTHIETRYGWASVARMTSTAWAVVGGLYTPP